MCFTCNRLRARHRAIGALHLPASLGNSGERLVLVRVESASRLPAANVAAGEAVFLGGGGNGGRHGCDADGEDAEEGEKLHCWLYRWEIFQWNNDRVCMCMERRDGDGVL